MYVALQNNHPYLSHSISLIVSLYSFLSSLRILIHGILISFLRGYHPQQRRRRRPLDPCDE